VQQKRLIVTELIKDTAIIAVECIQELSPWNGRL
jgi:hypothetical protein